MGADVGVDRAVFAQWLRWLREGDVDRVTDDLAALLADTDPRRPRPKPEPEPEPEPGRDAPSRPDRPPISTR